MKFLNETGLAHLWEKIKSILSGKADKSHTHTKSDITNFDHTHDDRYYTENEIDDKLETKSDSTHTHDDRYYTETEVDNKLKAKVDNTDFTKHVDDTNVHVTTEERTKWNNKSDFSGSYTDLTNKPLKLSEFTNDEGFITNTVNNLTNYYKKNDIDNLLSNLHKLDVEKITDFPANPSTTTIYLKAKPKAQESNIFDEYLYIDGKWEIIGDTKVDLSNYYNKTEIDNKLKTKANLTHTHTKSDITDFEHTHIWSEVTGKPETFTPSAHTHDDRYYTENEIDTKLKTKSDISHIHDNATSSSSGFMSSTDKAKLDTIASGANKTVVDDALNTSSTNPVQNKVIAGEFAKYLPLSGGTVTGNVVLQGGSTVHSGNGTSGSTGYVAMAKITITASYANAPLVFEIANRGHTRSTILYVQFSSIDGKDPALASFTYEGIACGAYMYKASTSTWNLYIQKSEAFDTVHVIRYHKPSYMDGRVTVTWTNVLASTLPSGGTSATPTSFAGNAASATKATQDKNGNDITTTYLPLAGGTMTGVVSVNDVTRKGGNFPLAFARTASEGELYTDLKNYPSFLGTFDYSNRFSTGEKSGWQNILSVRHRNGTDDGVNYGLYLRATLTTEDSLHWRQQITGKWTNEKTLLDNHNFTTYLNGTYLPLSGGTMTGNITMGTVSASRELRFPARETSNYIQPIRFLKGGTLPSSGDPAGIGYHSTGDTNGAIIINPVATTLNPWDKNVGLYISDVNLIYNGTAATFKGTVTAKGIITTEDHINLINATNPYISFLAGANKTPFYLQTTNQYEQIGLGSTWNNSLRVDKSGNVSVVGTISSNVNTDTYLAGSKGTAIINTPLSKPNYVSLWSVQSPNGVFTLSKHAAAMKLVYMSNSTISAGTNSPTYQVTLLDESGNASFPNAVAAKSFSGNATSASKLATAHAIKLAGSYLSGSANFDGTADASITATPVQPASGNYFRGLITVSSAGVSEVGKYLDFHNTSATTHDYDVRLQCATDQQVTVTLPSESGTLALTSDIKTYPVRRNIYEC